MIRFAPCALLALLLAGCATNVRLEEGRRLADAGNFTAASTHFERLSREDPANPVYRSQYIRYRDLAVAQTLSEGDIARASGEFARAEAAYKRALALDPASARAQAALGHLEAARRHRGVLEAAARALEAGDLAAAQAQVRAVLTETPGDPGARALARRIDQRQLATAPEPAASLGARFQKPISLELRDANLRQVFELISRSHGVNFIVDKDVRPDIRVTIFVRETSIDEVLKLILATHQLARKVLNPSTVLIYPNTPAKAKEHQELVTRVFYLGNADAKQTLTMIRTLVKTREVYIDEKLNLLIMRDTPDAVRYAEKLVASQDLADPEVMLEVEVLEVQRSKLQELGVRFPDRVNFGPLGASGAISPFAFSSDQLTAYVTNPAFVLNLRQLDGATNLLANPRIRVRNREKARIHIGERVPVVTTTSTANVGVSSNVSYLEIGLKLDVEPTVYLEDEIAIKVGLEVSNIIETLNLTNAVAYRLGTRNATTVLRLRDGETQVLAGLIQDEDRRSANKVPGLGDIPGLGRLFTNNTDNENKTEIVLLITPRVVRNLVRPEARLATFASGTDAAVGAPPLLSHAGERSSLTLEPSISHAGATPAGSIRNRAPDLNPTSRAPAPSSTQSGLTLGVPAAALSGEEIRVQLILPGGSTAREVSFELVYDPTQLQPRGGGAGRMPLTLRSSSAGAPATQEVPFRVVAERAGATMVAVNALRARDDSGQAIAIATPSPATIQIELR